MGKRSLFIVIEGLDGSGKTSAARQLWEVLNGLNKGDVVKLTYEPHDPSCAGTYIREVLSKKIRISSSRILPLAFAANRMDHCDREISPWLDSAEGRMVICDRYYVSSLVYQSSEDFPYPAVWGLNNKARKPDVIFFLNVSDEVCYERMKKRNQPEELFEKNLSNDRKKFLEALLFLKENNTEKVIEIDGSKSVGEVVDAIIQEIYAIAPEWKPTQAHNMG